MEDSVTVGKAYFEALLSRSVLLVNTVVEILKNALFRGGITPETLDLLVSNGGHHGYVDSQTNIDAWKGKFEDEKFEPNLPQAAPIHMTMPRTEMRWQQQMNPSAVTFAPVIPSGRQDRSHPSVNRDNSFDSPSSSTDEEKSADAQRPAVDAFGGGQHVARGGQPRTVLISNLSDRTTHKDITNIIRGGRLLDVYLRSHDRTAIVSFVEGAVDFFNYAKRNDFYIHTKRLEVRWHDRQFQLNGHVANKVANGATRNIVVRGGQGKLSEKEIRDHMEHIYNLVLIDVSFRSGDIYVSTNSIHNALFARTCMMSRSTYKGCKIEWYPDECATPLPAIHLARKDKVSLPSKKNVSLTNRFELLNTDGTETNSDEDDVQTTTGLSSYGVGLSWADNSIAA
ncbi:hypothetical protein B0A49_04622 [Cryomyces minteri]|uniref:RRM domain-containing protein n=1 Tax=Cryomyces minteri TaxID=331657 RepID=A0A4U0WUN2_9PEZI|nr:hypothetical protein B0A49_04622 [Cryomyces minteri]